MKRWVPTITLNRLWVYYDNVVLITIQGSVSGENSPKILKFPLVFQKVQKWGEHSPLDFIVDV